MNKNLKMINMSLIFRNYQKIMFTSVIIGLMLLVSGGTNQNTTLVINSTGPANSLMYEKDIIIDGNIDEWLNPVAIDEFYLDLDNSGDPNNLDGNNYLYVDEDPENLYIALDLPSDQTNDTNGEWISLALNTNTSFTDSWSNWADNFNKGSESLVYDVDNNQVWDPFGSFSTTQLYLGDAPDANVNAEYGSIVYRSNGGMADYSQIYSDPLYNYWVNQTSEPVASEHWSKIDFNFNLTRLVTVGADASVYTTNELLKLMDNFSLSINLRHNVSVLSSEAKMWYPDGSHSFSGYSRDILLNTNTSFTSFDIPFDKAIMDEKVFRFSLFTRNDVAFKTIVDLFTIKYDRPSDNPPYPPNNGYGDDKIGQSSIKNFEIAFNFTSSENNASDHRIFEFKIPKSELEGYNSDSDLGIYVGGYGTASFVGSNYWAYDGINPVPDDVYSFDSARYHYYQMPLKNPPDGFILSSLVNDHSVDLSWTASVNADNYTLFQSVTPITSISNALEVIGVFQGTTSPVNIQLPNGEYYFLVVASKNTGFIESNHVSVSIDIRTETVSTTITNTETTTITETGPTITQPGSTLTEPGSTSTDTVTQTTTIQPDTTTETVTATSVKTEESSVQMIPILLGFVILGFYKFKKTV
ncbi:MAG: hypothetical protein GPJ54_07290 [Candidatus Heimdallarchaeota archaeon]|nr:hypothetical protein [Candidatus Heimdallarchaeota archaeon]